MKVVIHFTNAKKMEKENIVDFKLENGFLRLRTLWRGRFKEISFNQDDIRFYEVIEGFKRDC